MQEIVIDANILMYLAADQLVESASQELNTLLMEGKININDVTYIECLAIPKEKRYLLPSIQRLVPYLSRIKLSDEIIELTLDLCQTLPIKFKDAIAAATALSLNCSIMTNDKRGFHHIKGLTILRAPLKD